MSYLRVNLVDFDSTQNRDDILDRIDKGASEMFPDIEMMLGIATGDKSCMTVSVYADKEKASKAPQTVGCWSSCTVWNQVSPTSM